MQNIKIDSNVNSSVYRHCIYTDSICHGNEKMCYIDREEASEACVMKVYVGDVCMYDEGGDGVCA